MKSICINPNRQKLFRKELLLCSIISLVYMLTLSSNAAPPALQTPEPAIYLADNLDEKDNLGWCIDT